MNREEAIKKLREAQLSHNYEVAHDVADNVLCELLKTLGYADVVEEWEKVGKWYA